MLVGDVFDNCLGESFGYLTDKTIAKVFTIKNQKVMLINYVDGFPSETYELLLLTDNIKDVPVGYTFDIDSSPNSDVDFSYSVGISPCGYICAVCESGDIIESREAFLDALSFAVQTKYICYSGILDTSDFSVYYYPIAIRDFMLLIPDGYVGVLASTTEREFDRDLYDLSEEAFPKIFIKSEGSVLPTDVPISRFLNDFDNAYIKLHSTWSSFKAKF